MVRWVEKLAIEAWRHEFGSLTPICKVRNGHLCLQPQKQKDYWGSVAIIAEKQGIWGSVKDPK